MLVVPFKPFHTCMNSNAVTLLSCGGGGVAVKVDNWDEAEAVTDATEMLSASELADWLGLGSSAVTHS